MIERPVIDTDRARSLKITVEQVFRANFNDTYWLEEREIPIDSIDRERLAWFDPYLDRSRIGNTAIAVAYCSDDRLVILERVDDRVNEIESGVLAECILCEDFDESCLLSARIRVCR